MKKILFVTCFNPMRIDTGAHQRTNNIWRALKSFSNLDTLFFNMNNEECMCSDILSIQVRSKVSKFSRIFDCLKFLSPKFIASQNRECVKQYDSFISKEKYDIIFFRYLSTAILCGVKDFRNVIIDVDDIPWHVHYLLSRRHDLSYLLRTWYFVKYLGIKYNTLKILKKSFACAVSNEQDVCVSNAFYLPNIPLISEEQSTEVSNNQNVLFVGAMSYRPNFEGVDHFIEKVWKKIILENSKAHLYIAGGGVLPYYKDKWQQINNIHVLGYVEDLKKLYQSVSVVICPINLGSGTNIKVIEALMMKKICICSKFAYKGFDKYFEKNRDLLVVDSDSDFFDKLKDVLSQNEKYKILAENGYCEAKRNFSFEFFKETLITKINTSRDV